MPETNEESRRLLTTRLQDYVESIDREPHKDVDHLTDQLKSVVACWSSWTSEERQELLGILCSAISHPRIVIEFALVCSNVAAKLVLSTQSVGEAECWLLEQADKGSSFYNLALTTGFLNSIGGGQYRAQLEKSTFLNTLFYVVYKACSSPPSSHTYQSFQALRVCTARIKEVSRVQPPDENIVTRTLQLVTTNLENPVRGVPDLVSEVMANIIDSVPDRETLARHLLHSTMDSLSWKVKSKYPPLSVLLPRIGVVQVVEDYEDFGRGLGESLTSNHLSSAGSSVYKLVLKAIDLDLWIRHFSQPLLDALRHKGSSIVRNNARNQWLPGTIVTIPGSGQYLLDNLDGQSCCVHSRVARLLVLKTQRVCGQFVQLDKDHLEVARQGICHSSAQVRMAAFSLLCQTKKKGCPPSQEEMSLVKRFIVENLSVDSASFRQVVLSDFTQLVIRCRDFSVAQYRRTQKRTCKADTYQSMLQVMTDVNHVLESVFANLFPGANYQRLITCLELLKVFNFCYFNYSDCGMNKGSGNGDPREMIKHLQAQHNLMDFYAPKHARALLNSCVLHYMADVKVAAGELLETFPVDKSVVDAVLEKGLWLTCSPKFGQCESAAVLLQLVSKWLPYHHTQWESVLKTFQHHALLGSCASVKQQPPESLCWFLLKLYQDLFGQRSTFLRLARHAPMHGLLTALRGCLPPSSERHNLEFMRQLIQTMTQSVEFMLAIFSGGVDNKNASFADMSEAIEAVIANNDDVVVQQSQDIAISEEHSLVLACSWLNLKECCMVAGMLHDTEYELVKQSGAIMATVLCNTRHKGALEAAAWALTDFSAELYKSHKSTRDIPELILSEALGGLTEAECSTSVTRRSAGLPLLVRALVSSEPRGTSSGRKLLATAMNHLLAVVSTDCIVSVETEDTPHCRALHVLQALVHDSALSHDISPYLSQTLRCCVNNFSSSSWAVRNAALQLFGSLVPRILGQKKVRAAEDTETDMGTLHNTISAQELFSRYPELSDYLLGQLIRSKEELLVNPALVPLLSMLSRVSPGVVIREGCGLNLGKFKAVFYQAFYSPVINVRKLAARAFISFTARAKLVQELHSLANEISAAKGKPPANFINGILICWLEGIRLLTTEYKTDYEQHTDQLKEAIQHMSMEYLTEPCYFNRVILADIRKTVGMTDCKHEEFAETKVFHPGYRDWLIKSVGLSDEPAAMDGSAVLGDQCRRFVADLRYQQDDKGKAVGVCAFLQANLQCTYLTGPLVEDCCFILQTEAVEGAIKNDVELAMDLIEVLLSPTVMADTRFGTSAKAASVVSAATCFDCMLLQDDYEMFFGDDSSYYVAQFCEMCEAISDTSSPRCTETQRICAATALVKLTSALNKRGGHDSKLSIHMRYNMVQLLNAALVLLTDEDPDVRHHAVEFASLLLSYQDCFYANVSPSLAVRKIVWYGLDRFPDCSDWFLPLADLSNVHCWTLNADSESKPTKKSLLFESGDGINVYSEEVATNLAYKNALMSWLDKNDGSHLKIRPNQGLLDLAEKVLQELSTQDLFGDLWTPNGFLRATRASSLLEIACQHKQVIDGHNSSISSEQWSTVTALTNEISTKLML